jgi:hypothetical protein
MGPALESGMIALPVHWSCVFLVMYLVYLEGILDVGDLTTVHHELDMGPPVVFRHMGTR